MPDRKKTIENLRALSNIAAYNGDIQSMRTMDDAIVLLEEQGPTKGWTPVTEGPPESGFDILMYGVETYKGYFDTEIKRFRLDDGYIVGGITHWMPLPDPPEGGKQQYD